MDGVTLHLYSSCLLSDAETKKTAQMTSEPLSNSKVLLVQKTVMERKQGKWKKKNPGGKLSLARLVLTLGSLLLSLSTLHFFSPAAN